MNNPRSFREILPGMCVYVCDVGTSTQ